MKKLFLSLLMMTLFFTTFLGVGCEKKEDTKDDNKIEEIVEYKPIEGKIEGNRFLINDNKTWLEYNLSENVLTLTDIEDLTPGGKGTVWTFNKEDESAGLVGIWNCVEIKTGEGEILKPDDEDFVKQTIEIFDNQTWTLEEK